MSATSACHHRTQTITFAGDSLLDAAFCHLFSESRTDLVQRLRHQLQRRPPHHQSSLQQQPIPSPSTTTTAAALPSTTASPPPEEIASSSTPTSTINSTKTLTLTTGLTAPGLLTASAGIHQTIRINCSGQKLQQRWYRRIRSASWCRKWTLTCFLP